MQHLPESITTERLILKTITLNDAGFMFKLMNSPGWIANIGDRKIANDIDAENYIKKLLANPQLRYWVIFEQQIPIGILSFMQRDHLDHPDIGFALLPETMGKGFATEATQAVMKFTLEYKKIAAVVMPVNTQSISLLTRLGFSETSREGELILFEREN